jgi:hypothetical protein
MLISEATLPSVSVIAMKREGIQSTSLNSPDVVREYRDEGISGSKDSRPELDRLMKDARGRRFDVVVARGFSSDKLEINSKAYLDATLLSPDASLLMRSGNLVAFVSK